MTQIPVRKLLKAIPLVFLLLICIKLLIEDYTVQTSGSLIRTLNSLQNIQTSFLQHPEDSGPPEALSNSDASHQENLTIQKPQDNFRSWFDGRPEPAISTVTHHIDEHPIFKGYAIENRHVCGKEKVDVLVYLHSAVPNKEQRHAIRQSWGSSKTFSDISVKLIFLLGTTNELEQQLRLKSEAATYGDIIQGRFEDRFNNLAHKAVTMMAWVFKHCPQARYIVKADDDMFVDLFRIVSEFIPEVASKQHAFVCDQKVGMKIVRSKNSKWYVPESVMKGKVEWPPFCPGYFMMMTGNLIPHLFQRSFSVSEYIPIDDAYLFGVLAEGIKPLDVISLKGKISPQTRADPVQELKANGKFEYLAFAAGGVQNHGNFWAHRSKKLSSWESRHSAYTQIVIGNMNGTLIVN